MINKQLFSFGGGQSQYNAFVRFNEFYVEAFRQLGCEVHYLSTEFALTHREISNGFLFYFAHCNNEVLRNIYDAMPLLPVVNHFIDHPLDFLFPTQETEVFIPSQLPIVFDISWIEFLERHKKQDSDPPQAALYLPLAGFVHPEISHSNGQPSCSQRKTEILFAGSIVSPESLRKNWYERVPFLAQAIDTVVEHTSQNNVNLLDIFLEQRLNPECVRDMNCISTIFRYANEYTRTHYRLKLLRTLAQAGVPATVYSNHPELLNKLVGKHNFEVRPPVDFMDLLKLMAQSKMVLNCRPNTQGMTERVPSTMLNGAVSINDTNTYLSQEFVDGQEAIFYDYQKLEELPDKIFHLLSHPDELDTIAMAGQRKAQERHTVLHRVQTILDSVEQFRAMLLNAHHTQ